MLDKLKHLIALDNPFRLLYHKIRAVLANIVYGFPSSDMTIIWVTWTNWKTTTCNIIAKWLIKAWEKVFMFSTVNIIMWDQEFINETKMTSPDVFELQRLLKMAKKQGIKTAIIETASHGIKMSRVRGINYDIVALTNITQDHLDLHKTMEDYVNTKLQIFKNLITYKRKPLVKKSAIVNIDSDYHSLFTNETYDVLYRYGKAPESDLQIIDIKEEQEYNTFKIKVWAKTLDIKTKLRWAFNAYNITASIGVFMCLNIKQDKILEIVKDISPVAWRLEEVENIEWFKIFIDYAHTPDALENTLGTINEIKWNWKIITVFWATWDRDKTKRPIMWEIVSRLSDKVVLTQDDDYSEKTWEIIKDVLLWIERKEGEDFWIITDREEAIRNAILQAEAWDTILIAWKWDEHVMVTNAWAIPWHDKTKVQEILKALDDNKIVN